MNPPGYVRPPAGPGSPFAARVRGDALGIRLRGTPAPHYTASVSVRMDPPPAPLFQREDLPGGFFRTRPHQPLPAAAPMTRAQTVPHTSGTTTHASVLAPFVVGLWLCAASCASSNSETPAAAMAAQVALENREMIDPALRTYANSVPSISIDAGLNALTASTFADPDAVRRIVTGMFNGITSAELGIVTAGVLVNRFVPTEGHNAEHKSAWGRMVQDGMELVFFRLNETIQRIAQEDAINMDNPEVLMTIPVGTRMYQCTDLPPALSAHLVALQKDNFAAMQLYAQHVRWLRARGLGETAEQKAVLTAGLLGSKTIVRGDLCEVLDRYRSPAYEQTLRAHLTNPLFGHVPGESPGLLDVYETTIRSAATHTWDNVNLLTGYAGLGAMIGLLLAGSLLRRRRSRRVTIKRTGMTTAAVAAKTAAADQFNELLQQFAQTRQVSPEQLNTLRAAVVADQEAVDGFEALTHNAPDPFWSKARWRRRGESFAFYVPIIFAGMMAGAAIQTAVERSSPQVIPILLPELRPVPVERIGIGYAQREDLGGYPEAVMTLVNELNPSAE